MQAFMAYRMSSILFSSLQLTPLLKRLKIYNTSETVFLLMNQRTHFMKIDPLDPAYRTSQKVPQTVYFVLRHLILLIVVSLWLNTSLILVVLDHYKTLLNYTVQVICLSIVPVSFRISRSFAALIFVVLLFGNLMWSDK